MQIIKFSIKEKPKLSNEKQRVIVLGKFKSFHKGHQSIFIKGKQIVEQQNKELIVMMYPDFDGFKQKNLDSIFPYSIRLRLIKQYNPKYILEFEPNVMNYSVSRESFLEYLINELNVSDIIVGENFNFGKNKPDDFEVISKYANLVVVPLFKYREQIISTTLLEKMILEGEVGTLNKGLGFNFSFEGKIIFGNQRGTKNGTPTINVEPIENTLQPKQGVYFSKTYLKDKIYNSITSISDNPTFDDKIITWESYIFDFNENVYKEYARVELLEYYRQPIKFENTEELFKKIDNDKERAINFFKTLN